ncbi:MAG: aryl-sulfate sulfotransferase [Acidobacteriota bacterium]
MSRPCLSLFVSFLVLTSHVSSAWAEVGMLHRDDRSEGGYTLFGPSGSTFTYLLDDHGNLVHRWGGDSRPGLSVYLEDDGVLLRCAKPLGATPVLNGGGSGGRLQRWSWDSELLWEYTLADDLQRLHHDVEILPNGNILALVWERWTEAEALALGRDPGLIADGELWTEAVLELRPTLPTGAEIVWSWHAADHLVQDFDPASPDHDVVADRPERINLNYSSNGGADDWHHANGIDYNEELELIVISVRAFHELWVIDHSTTTEEAADSTGGRRGRGGDLLYRWGNPQTYDRGTADDRQLFGQHDVQWVPAGYPGEGNFTIFNNGQGRPDGTYSTIDEITPPTTGDGGEFVLEDGQPYGPAAPTWIYSDPAVFYSQNISGTHRLRGGNTLACQGRAGRLIEVTPEGDVAWEYVNPDQNGSILDVDATPGGNSVFRATRIPADDPRLDGLDLDHQGPLENRLPTEVSPLGSVTYLHWTDRETLAWEDGARSHSVTFSLYRGILTDLRLGRSAACSQRDVPQSMTTDVDLPPAREGYYYLVAGHNGAGEGPLGFDSSAVARTVAAPCP